MKVGELKKLLNECSDDMEIIIENGNHASPLDTVETKDYVYYVCPKCWYGDGELYHRNDIKFEAVDMQIMLELLPDVVVLSPMM